MWKRIAIPFLSILATSAGMAAADHTVSRIPFTAKPPVMDGVIEKGEWENAAVLSQFCDAGGGGVPPSPTLAMLQYDGENLYFAFRAVIDFEPEIAPLPHDNLDITTVDSIRIGIVPPGVGQWMKFSLERGGGTGDIRVAGQVRLPAEEWNPAWQAACRILPQAFFAANIWEAEVAIPWSTLEMSMPKPGDVLPLQITRYAGNVRRTPDVNHRQSTWAPVPSIWNIIDPTGFGRVIFGGDAPVFRFGSYADFAGGTGGVKGTLTAAAPTARLTARIWDTADYNKVFAQTAEAVSGPEVDWRRELPIAVRQPVMMQWKLTDDAGEIAGAQLLCEVIPPFSVAIAPVFSRDAVVFLGDLAKIADRNGMKVINRLSAADGTKVEREIEAAAADFETALPLADFPVNAELTAESTLLDATGNVRYRVEKKIRNVPRPEWMSRHPGEVTVPPPGWTALRVNREAHAIVTEAADNSYTFTDSFLPEAIGLAGKAFSAGAMRFDLATADGTQTIHGQAATVAAEDARGVTLEWNGESADFTLQAKIRVEFDAMAWYRVTLTPRRDTATVEHLALVLPVEPRGLRYMRGGNAMGTMEGTALYALVSEARTGRELPKPNMPFAIEVSGDGWKFDKSFVNFLWLGGEDRGMFFILPSRRNLNIAEDFTSVTDDGKNFTLRINLIDTPTEFRQPFGYEFGTVLTPTRRVEDVARLWKTGAAYQRLQPDGRRIMEQDPALYTKPTGWRFFHDRELKPFAKDYFATAMLPSWLVPTVMIGNPTPDAAETAAIDGFVKAINDTIGGSPLLWYDSLFSMFHLPQAVDFVEEWELNPRCRLPIEQYGTMMCPTRTWADYYLYGAENRMKQGVRSFYMDMSAFHACDNRFHGCGVRDERTGAWLPVIPFLNGREMFMRFQNLVKANDPEGLLVMHSSISTPMALWMDVTTMGEEWTTAPDYSTFALETFQLGNMGTRQLGTVSNFFPGLLLLHYLQAQISQVTLAEVCGITFLHGESMWNGVEEQLAGLRQVWDALAQFGVHEADAEWIPYWRNPLSRYPDGIAVSSWKRGGAEMLVIFNPAYQAVPFTLPVHSNRNITDALTGEVVSDSMQELEARGFRLWRID